MRSDDAPGPCQQSGLARDQRRIRPKIGDGGGGTGLGRHGIEPGVDFGHRIAGHQHVEAAPAERAGLVEPGQPGLGHHEVAGAIVDCPSERVRDLPVVAQIGPLAHPARRPRDPAHGEVTAERREGGAMLDLARPGVAAGVAAEQAGREQRSSGAAPRRPSCIFRPHFVEHEGGALGGRDRPGRAG